MAQDPELAPLVAPAQAAEAPEPAAAGGNYSWGSPLMPWEIAANGQRFVQDHVRMQDVLMYIRDLLRSYAALQRFKVKPLAKSACYTGDRVLEQFAFPHKARLGGAGRGAAAALCCCPSLRPLRRWGLGRRLCLYHEWAAHAACLQIDGERVERAYPWLKGYDAGCKAAEEVWGTFK